MIKFKINELITLKLENEKTVIYIANERFRHCRFLLLSIPIKKIRFLDEIESIDEAVEILDKSLEPELDGNGLVQRELIPPKVEFWAHCSNLQVWVENEYSTQLLHSNIAFPLLRKLYSLKDPLAIKVFKKEIGKRLESGFPTVVEYLVLQGYLEYLNEDEFNSVIQNPKIIKALIKLGYKDEEDQYHFYGLYELIKKVKTKNITYLKTLVGGLLESSNLELLYFLDRTNIMRELNETELAYKLLNSEEAKAVVELRDIIQKKIIFAIAPELRGTTIFVEDGHVVELDLSYCGLNKIPIQLLKFKQLKECDLQGNLITFLPNSIEVLKEIKIFDLSNNKISNIPETIVILKNLENLNLKSNLLEYLPDNIGDLKSLKTLNVSNNRLKKIPESLNKLTKLNIINKNKI